MNADDILKDILGKLKAELGSGFSGIQNFAKRQGRMLARQAQFIAEGRVNGTLADDEYFEDLLKGLELNTENMVRSIAALSMLTVEKAWNAVANALWGGISQILSAAGVPSNLIPPKPPKVVI